MATRTLVSARSPAYANPDSTAIRLMCVFEELKQYGEIPFVAAENDVESHGRDIFQRALAGEFGAVAAYVDPGTSK